MICKNKGGITMKMIDRVTKALEQCIEDSDFNYYEEQVFMLEDHGYKVKYMDEKIKDIRRWETDTEYVYEIEDKNTGESVLIGIIDTSGNTESQENQGITDVYEVFPTLVTKTVYKRKEQ